MSGRTSPHDTSPLPRSPARNRRSIAPNDVARREQITKLVDNPEFKAHTLKAFHVVDGFQVVRCSTGTAIPTRIENLVAIRRELGIQ